MPLRDGHKYTYESFDEMQVVGEGTYGKVYKARVKGELDDYRALKLLKLDEEREGWPITSLREILILKQLRHDNIVSLLDVFVHRSENSEQSGPAAVSWRKNRIYLVFEFVPHDLMGLIDYKLKWGPA